MTWDLFLYPMIEHLPASFRWRWTWLRAFFSALTLVWRWYSAKDSSSGVPQSTKLEKSSHSSIVDSDILPKVMQLESDIWTQDAQSWYTSYQNLLSKIVYAELWIDLSHQTLASIKFSHTWLPSSLIRLLEQTYYYPYNQEQGDKKLMKKHSQELLTLLNPDE